MRPDLFRTGSLALDAALGVGGWPRGHLVEVFGDETTGKTTLGLLAARSACRAGEEAAYLDADHTFDARYAVAVGVPVGRALVSQPETGEQALDTACKLLRGGVAVVIIDSVAALMPAAELAGRLENGVAHHRRLVERAARQLFDLVAERNALAILLNRPAQRKGRDGWVAETSGGALLPGLASVRVELRRLEGGPQVTRVRASVVKNTLGVQGRAACADLVLGWGRGLDWPSDLLVAGYDLGVIGAAGGRFFFDGEPLGFLAEARERLAGPLAPRVITAIETAILARTKLPSLPIEPVSA